MHLPLEPRRRAFRAVLPMLIAGFGSSLLSGCGSLFTGYDADTQFKCRAPAGVQCQSISGVYANSQGGGAAVNAVVPQDTRRAADQAGTLPLPAARNMGAGLPPTYEGAIRSEPTTIRTWVMAYKDLDGDIVDQFYVYMALDSGSWMLEHAQQMVRETYAPVRAPRTAGLPSAGAGLHPTPAAEVTTTATTTPNRRATGQSEQGDDGMERPSTSNGAATAHDPSALIRQIQQTMERAGRPGGAGQSGLGDLSSESTR